MCVFGTLGVLFDQTSTVLRRGDHMLIRNAIFGVATLAVLVSLPLGILVALKKTNPPPVSHTLKALEYGAQPAEIADGPHGQTKGDAFRDRRARHPVLRRLPAPPP